MEAFGFMLHLAQAFGPETISWIKPTLLGQVDPNAALLPYWLGAWAIQLAPQGLPLDAAAHIPFAGLLALTLFSTWYGAYALARTPAAQPVAFAFGGEAQPADYARAVADGGLLALLAGALIQRYGDDAIETAIDRIGTEWHALSKRAKDMGSAAVLLSLLLCLGIWLAAIWNLFHG
jgi:hypothetical protein